MSLLSTSVLALSMSADAFAVSVGKGTAMEKPRLGPALRTAAVFGGMEGLMPILGWLAGLAASAFIQSIDHWIAFGILAAIGVKMIVDGVRSSREDRGEGEAQAEQAAIACAPCRRWRGACLLVVTAVGTSIDSLSVGVSLAFLDANIWVSAAAIGLASFCMSTLGQMIGHAVGRKVGAWAELLGGSCLLLIGGKILSEHLGLL